MTSHDETIVDRMPAVGLDELNSGAALLTRTDRKYVIASEELDAVLTAVPGLRVLEIDGRRSARYESTYFDTVDLDSWTASARDRRQRWKVRTRTYADTGECWLEVKTRGSRGSTVKERLPHGRPDVVDTSRDAREWVLGRLRVAHVDGIDPRALVATLSTRYARTTLLLPDGAGRATVDRNLRWDAAHGTLEVGDVLVVETKSGSTRPGSLDRRLWELGHRPTRISKYGTGLALLTPNLPRNRWHRVSSRILAGCRPEPAHLSRPRSLDGSVARRGCAGAAAC
ncbi:VTC domain-containing protein [Alloalcanivorax gelatiniphagus]